MQGTLPPVPRWELYRLLAEPVRMQLLALTAGEELAIGELAGLLSESQPNVSRHIGALKSGGLVMARRQGTRVLVRMTEAVSSDAVVADAVAQGRALCEADGSFARLADVVRDRDAIGREFFEAQKAASSDLGPSVEPVSAYVSALSCLLPRRKLAVDVGTGDGVFLDLLAPAFERVVAVDRSEAQLGRARARIAQRGYANVSLVRAEAGTDALRAHVGAGADVVIASRLLHHAPRPVELVRQLAVLARPGGAVLIVDYERHDDEGMRDEADLWLGFEPAELVRFAEQSGLSDVHVHRLSPAWCGKGRDAHLPWQVLAAKTPAASESMSA